ncbi:hypothetical protein Bca52824_038305 [Brassica carinata]|uniref:Uncharacterized protein n=1 Tax=Brassica carinata TaxID=52824 RepID=A0A8X7UX19_BRACI|nr:hypothetical protein Bca52824_038305 [Brassica carinata]
MKHGYVDVTSKPTAPIRTARYVKNENPTATKKPTEPNNIIRTKKEQGFCVLVMYTISSYHMMASSISDMSISSRR